MKKILFIFVGTLSLSALAQTTDNETVTVRPKLDYSLTGSHYPMQHDEFYKFVRVYELSNGMQISLYECGRAFCAKLNERTPERIVATASNNFHSTASNLRMHIVVDGSDKASGEVVIPSAYLATANSGDQKSMALALR